MTRVNGIYEKRWVHSVSIWLPNNFDIMYYDAATDPFDGGITINTRSN
jgi:hypothetical protein